MQRHGPIRPLHVTLTIQCVQMENIKHINESQLKSFLYDIHQERNYNLKDARYVCVTAS